MFRRVNALIERRATRYQQSPLSVRNAVSLIFFASAIVALGSAALMRIFDRDEYPHYGRALWWAVQTIPTVGYGDVTPARASGRIIATFVMLWGIGLLSILTALITSTFVARAARERRQDFAEAADTGPDTKLDEINARLDRIESLLSKDPGGTGGA
jgi:voltage-gated potassium channel